MPYRKNPLITKNTYHIINQGFKQQKIFIKQDDYFRAQQTINYYQYPKPPLRFFYFYQQSLKRQKQILNQLSKDSLTAVEIYSFCLMPNHFHLLAKQTQDNGILHLISNFSTSYSKYFNQKYKKQGPVFQGRFKAVKINSNEQLLHVSRYIHLNPYSSSIIKSFKNLINYPYSSFSQYLKHSSSNICNVQPILNQFSSPKHYKKFVLNQADYQKQLHSIKKLTLE